MRRASVKRMRWNCGNRQRAATDMSNANASNTEQRHRCCQKASKAFCIFIYLTGKKRKLNVFPADFSSTLQNMQNISVLFILFILSLWLVNAGWICSQRMNIVNNHAEVEYIHWRARYVRKHKHPSARSSIGCVQYKNCAHFARHHLHWV